MLAGTLDFTGETLRQALAATFTRRATPLLVLPPVALTTQFTGDPAKQALWQAFLRKGRLETDGKTLAEIALTWRNFCCLPHGLRRGAKVIRATGARANGRLLRQ